MFEFLKQNKGREKKSSGPPPPEEIHIQIRGVHKSFDDNHVLNGIDLDLHREKINMIIGGSGSGKSVLLKHMLALITPDTGEIFVDGLDIVGKDDFELRAVRRKFGMLFQYSALFDSMSVMDNIAFPMREHTKLKEKEIREKVQMQLDLLHLGKAIDKFPAELSGGMRKRVALARALALNPKIILFDEPTSGLDPILTKEIDDLIFEVVQREKMTCVVITHDIASAFRLGDYISMIHQGRIIASGSPRDVTQSSHPAVQEFIELSGIDIQAAHA
jgi:phospholipid/cholesterol/gamma-HCH transport system ATP-binding protein